MPTSTLKTRCPSTTNLGPTFVRLTTVIATHVSRPPRGGVLRRRRVSVLLLDKSLASMRRAIGAINGMDEMTTAASPPFCFTSNTAAEMLLKAGLFGRPPVRWIRFL